MSFPYEPFADDGERAIALAHIEAARADIQALSEHIQNHDTIDYRDKNHILGPFVAMEGWLVATQANIEKVILEEAP